MGSVLCGNSLPTVLFKKQKSQVQPTSTAPQNPVEATWGASGTDEGKVAQGSSRDPTRLFANQPVLNLPLSHASSW